MVLANTHLIYQMAIVPNNSYPSRFQVIIFKTTFKMAEFMFLKFSGRKCV